jgi:hypothetical protein
MIRILAALILTALPSSQNAAPAEPQLPGWMTGCWEQKDGDRWTEECWTVPRAGMMMGSSRGGIGQVTREWETMQIVRDQPNGEGPAVPMAFWASPGGAPRTMFVWSPTAEPGVTFRNAANDYPQRIRYWRDGEELLAEISMADGSHAMRWRFRPMR